MLSDLRIQRTPQSRRSTVDYTSLGFGNVFSDHMFTMRYFDGAWQQPEVVPYGPIGVEPGCLSLHYGQSVFEGLKAFRGPDDRVRVFRPDMNAKRFQDSCERLCIPPLDDGVFEAAVRELVRIDHEWIPTERGQALYIRPIVFALESHLEVRPASSYLFMIIAAPVRTYYERDAKAVALKVQDQFTRAAPGGVGFAKTAGNYAASLLPGDESRREGFDQALWLDGAEHKYVEEVGQMNIFFDLGGTVVTPELRGTILPGITRASVLQLLSDRGVRTEQRRIEIGELTAAIENGELREAFGAGTATVVAPVGKLAYQGQTYEINRGEAGPLTGALYDEILGIQLGEIPDRHGWNMEIMAGSQSVA
ncbi:MAG: branched-chain amino acid aminotransferase [Gammaproteobacteria bacterium]|nr:branched-chain amino acid aminotransferase [Gammaproteobacteria bacterium]